MRLALIGYLQQRLFRNTIQLSLLLIRVRLLSYIIVPPFFPSPLSLFVYSFSIRFLYILFFIIYLQKNEAILFPRRSLHLNFKLDLNQDNNNHHHNITHLPSLESSSTNSNNHHRNSYNSNNNDETNTNSTPSSRSSSISSEVNPTANNPQLGIIPVLWLDLLEIPASQIANVLTELEFDLFCNIQPFDLVERIGWTGPTTTRRGKNPIEEFVNRFNEVSNQIMLIVSISITSDIFNI